MKMQGGFSNEERAAAIAACFGCSEESATLLATYMIERRFARRTPIALRGDVCTQIYLILDGNVAAEIFGFDGLYAQLARHGPGEIFGAYPAPGNHRANITALCDTRLLSVGALDLVSLAQAHADIGAGLSQLLARQLDLLLDRMAARIGLSANGRFHKALLELADSEGVINPAPVISALALSVNTTRETASRALAALLRRGIVERHADTLRIVSRRMLEELVV